MQSKYPPSTFQSNLKGGPMKLWSTICRSQSIRSWSITASMLLLLCSSALSHAQAVDESSYVLDSGDRIAIQVFDEQDLSMEAVIDSNGVINYSFLGSLEVRGKTTEEIEQRITELLKDGYLVSPSVNVTVTGYRLFYISGEVNKPGGYPYVPGLNLEQAVAMAGGMTDRASKRKMYLIKGKSADKRRTRVKLNASINPGDTITIEEGFF